MNIINFIKTLFIKKFAVLLLFFLISIICYKYSEKIIKYFLIKPIDKNGLIRKASKYQSTDYKIVDKNICIDKRPVYIVYVLSNVENFEVRNIFRKSWAQKNVIEDVNSILIFVLGDKKDEKGLNKKLFEEQNKYGDLLQGDFEDDYYSLTAKGILFLQFNSEFCQVDSVKFIIKTDDDTFVHIFNLYNLMDYYYTRGSRRFIMCHRINDGSIVRNENSKFYIEDKFWKSYTHFPEYCSGVAYFYTSDVSLDLYELSKNIEYFKFEDIYFTGFLPLKMHDFKIYKITSSYNIWSGVEEFKNRYNTIFPWRTPIVLSSSHVNGRINLLEIWNFTLKNLDNYNVKRLSKNLYETRNEILKNRQIA